MAKLSRKWLVEIEKWRNWNSSESFVSLLNKQLPAEFESLTGKMFDRKRFHFMIGYENELVYHSNDEIPFGEISGILMFTGTSINIRFKWFDASSKLLYKVEDDISNSNVEFHWIDLPVDCWEIQEIRESKLYDIREFSGFDVSFPVLSYSKSIGTDVSFNFKLKNKSALEDILNVLTVAKSEWNSQTDKNGIYAKGVIHSVRYSHENDDGQAVFPIDIGSANEDVFKFIINKLGKTEIPILELEIENG